MTRLHKEQFKTWFYRSFIRPLKLLCRHLRHWRSFVSIQGKEEARQELRELYQLLCDFLQRAEVEFFLDAGTLLGQHRDGDIVLGDKDVDLGLFAEDFERVWEARALLPPGIVLRDTSFRHLSPKLHLEYKGWKGDLYFYERRGDTLVWESRKVYPCSSEAVPREEILPLRKVEFLDRHTAVPQKSEEFLKRRFGYLGPQALRDRRSGLYRPRR